MATVEDKIASYEAEIAEIKTILICLCVDNPSKQRR